MKKKYVTPVARGIEDGKNSYNVVPAIVAAAVGAAASVAASAAVSKVLQEDFTSRITTDANSRVELIYE